MGMLDKVIQIITDGIKTESRLMVVSDQIRELAKEIRAIEKRILRIETVMEVSDLLKTKETRIRP
jgi:hypothetical protein